MNSTHTYALLFCIMNPLNFCKCIPQNSSYLRRKLLSEINQKLWNNVLNWKYEKKNTNSVVKFLNKLSDATCKGLKNKEKKRGIKENRNSLMCTKSPKRAVVS